MTPEEREKAIKEIKEICKDIGCSKVYPSLCDEKPFNCKIIRKLIMGK
jgi:hypothetical protein